MIALETLKIIALLCQVSVASSGAGRDARIDSVYQQKECHKYYAGCIKSNSSRSEAGFAEDLIRCMEARK
jgi:hypothetical protein